MKDIADLTDYREQIYLILKKIIDETIPDKLFLFELGWGSVWNKICQLKDKDPREWKIEDLQETTSGVFPYPSDAENQEVKAITLTATAIGTELIGAKRNLSAEEKEEIVNTYIEQFSPPEYARQEILSTYLKTGKDGKSSVERKTKEPLLLREKTEYKVYSHEYREKPYKASKSEIDRLRKLNPEEKNKKFHIFLDDEKGHIVVKGEIKKFVGEEGREKLRLKKLLYLFLTNVGNRIGYSKIKFDVMRGPTDKDEDEATDSAVQQLKKRLCEFAEQELSPFIVSSTNVETGKKGYFIKEENNGVKFKYCMILLSRK